MQQQKHPYLLPATMWVLCVIFYGYQYFLQVSPSVMTQDLMRDFGVNATALGSLAGSYFYTYSAMQIPVGLAFDHFSVRRPLTIAALLCTLGCFLFAATPFFSITIFGRLLIGLGGAFGAVGTMYIAATWLPARFFSLLLGLDVAAGMLGAICGQAPLAFLTDKFGWHNTAFIFTGVGILLAIIIWCVMRDLPRKNRPVDNKKAQKYSVLHGLKHIMRNRQIWLLAIYGGLMFMPISVLGSLWGTPFLMHKYGINNTAAGKIITMLFIGMAIGTPFFGWLSDHVKRRKAILLVAALGSLICILGVIYLSLSQYFTSLLLLSYSFFAGGSLVCFAAAHESDKTNSAGVTMGFVNMLNVIGGAIAQPAVGLLLDFQWGGAIENGVRSYTLANFQVALTLIPLSIALALILLFFVKETYRKNH